MLSDLGVEIRFSFFFLLEVDIEVVLGFLGLKTGSLLFSSFDSRVKTGLGGSSGFWLLKFEDVFCPVILGLFGRTGDAPTFSARFTKNFI